MEVDQRERRALNPDAQHRPADGANVLFEPRVEAQEENKLDDAMEVSSAKTNPGEKGVRVGGGVQVTDASLLTA